MVISVGHVVSLLACPSFVICAMHDGLYCWAGDHWRNTILTLLWDTVTIHTKHFYGAKSGKKHRLLQCAESREGFVRQPVSFADR